MNDHWQFTEKLAKKVTSEMINYFKKLGDTERSTFYNNKAIDSYDILCNILKTTKADYKLQIEVLLAKGKIFLLSKNFNKTNIVFYKALEIAKKNKETFLIYTTLNQIGSSYLYSGEYKKAEKTLNTALTQVRQYLIISKF